jgi:hypothetical protein
MVRIAAALLVLGAAASAAADPAPVPLTTARLYQIALAAGIGTNAPEWERRRRMGESFEDFTLAVLQVPHNTRRYLSRLRADATRRLSRQAVAVVPDGVRDLPEIGDGLISPTQIHSQASWYEVKAIRGNLRLSSGNHQIAGLIDALASIPFGPSMGARPTLTFVTTIDTRIGDEVTALATHLGVAIWQIMAYEVPGKGLCLGQAQLLNPYVYLQVPMLGRPGPTPRFSAPRPLRPAPPSTNPDPPVVE